MKFVISGYTDKISLIELDYNFNLLSRIDQTINNSSFIVASNNIFCYDREKNPFIYMLSKQNLEIINKIKVNIDTITHLTYSDKNNILFGCSYSGGTFFGIKIKENKFEKIINIIREEDVQVLSRCHCVLLNKKQDTLVVVNIATDKLNFYNILSDSLNYFKSIELPKGCGPRHAIYSKSETYIYVMTEYSNEVIVINVEKECIVSSSSTLQNKSNISHGATLFIDDNALYASNRGEETIVKFNILTEDNIVYNDYYFTYGSHSRHMIQTNDRKHIITCNKNSNNICFINKLSKNKDFELYFESPSCIVQTE